MIIAYLGPAKSYSYLAAVNMSAKGDELREFPTFYDILMSVGNGTDAAVVPIENSIEGAVGGVLDLLVWESKLYINGEYNLKLDNRLFLPKGGDFGNIRRIMSHAQAYGQCRKFLSRKYPNAEIVFTDSTSKAVEDLSEERPDVAAVAGFQNLKDGLKVLDENIQDSDNNVTRFVMLSQNPGNNPSPTKTSVVFEAENRPGGLLELLMIFARHNLSMTKIESRPYKGELGRYVFFVDFAGDLSEGNLNSALNELERNTRFYKFLGRY